MPRDLTLTGDPWPEPVSEVFVAPIVVDAQSVPVGYVLFGISPRLAFDDAYQAYLQRCPEHIAHA